MTANWLTLLEQNPSSEASSSLSSHYNCVRLAEPEFSLACPQQPATCPYPEPDESYITLGLQTGFFPSHFPTKTLQSFFFLLIRATFLERLLHLHLITLLIYGEEYTSWILSFCSLWPTSFQAQVSLSAPLSRMSWACVISLMWEAKFHTHTKQHTTWLTHLLHGTLWKYSITHKPLPTVKSSSLTEGTSS